MEKMGNKSISGLAANCLIIAMVILGTMFFVNISGATEDEGLISYLFSWFLVGIIALQLIPGVVLIGAMIKGLARNARYGVKHLPVAGNDSKD